MDSSKYLETLRKEEEAFDDKVIVDFGDFEYRQAKALEIIAEQIINLDNTLACVVNTLENIETAIRQK